jgi:hypothetical protein
MDRMAKTNRREAFNRNMPWGKVNFLFMTQRRNQLNKRHDLSPTTRLSSDQALSLYEVQNQ